MLSAAPLSAVCGELVFAAPHWFTYRLHVKRRWLSRTVPEVFAEEFYGTEQSWKENMERGLVLVNGAMVSAPLTYRMKDGDLLSNRVHFHEMPVSARDRPRILGETSEYLLAYKPAGMPTHPCGLFRYHSLTEYIARQLQVGGRDSPDAPNAVYAVNRLDRVTSGVVILAKSGQIARQWHALQPMLTDRDAFHKVYIARVLGRFAEPQHCNVPLSLQRITGGYTRSVPDWQQGKAAVTEFVPLGYDVHSDTSLVECRPLTGRTHQIRAHLQHLGHPVANDVEYGGRRYGLGENTTPGQDFQDTLYQAAHADIDPLVRDLFPDAADSLQDADCHHCPHAAPERWRERTCRRQMGIYLHAASYSVHDGPLGQAGFAAQAEWPEWASSRTDVTAPSTPRA
ncbi:hypothetical protein CDCA_CDCA02G0622 [Cyanidium caldarium]|uniref:Pseudouridine synthase RsuA/RluA-like domain-containing protein n=1 Tax=Cyanidium caldarium TaxID=2771 RepID=A0AAV9IQF1_CYACA|nr:hypothetical protein CDCA_CDCA02G0622 [Cyanidium caldarium]